ncbi:MAG TPA: MFS transporter, partial [Burkholderiales bacterium]|nr:MFS transporter [Burkholderiales bacterium]
AIATTVPLEYALRFLGWREVFEGISALTVVASALLWAVVPERDPHRRGGGPLMAQLREFAALAHDPAFWRVALCIGASQLAAVSLGTLWVATWLRDVGGLSRAEVARALLAFSLSMLAGYLGFGRAADALARGGRSTLPLLGGGVAVSSLCLAVLATGPQTGAVALWCLFFGASTAVVLSYALFSRRYPTAMAGRVNTALNVFVFVGMFSGQWAVGAVLNLWPRSATGYALEGYRWALAMLWTIQAAGLAWLWSGRRLLQRPAGATSG